MTVTERRQAVIRAINAIEGRMREHGVMAFHVRYFGVYECVDAGLDTIKADLLWLGDRSYVSQIRGGPGRGPSQYRTTREGRDWGEVNP